MTDFFKVYLKNKESFGCLLHVTFVNEIIWLWNEKKKTAVLDYLLKGKVICIVLSDPYKGCVSYASLLLDLEDQKLSFYSPLFGINPSQREQQHNEAMVRVLNTIMPREWCSIKDLSKHVPDYEMHALTRENKYLLEISKSFPY